MGISQGKQGRSLKLFLTDGSPTGVIVAELGGWSGKVLVAARSKLPELIGRKETKKTGVYLLTGPDPTTGCTSVYVGEADRIRDRLANHDRSENRQFFDRIYVIVSAGDTMTKAHGRYLESRILHLIRNAKRGRLINSNMPSFTGLPESDIADMDRFLEEIEVVLPVVGCDLFSAEPNPIPTSELAPERPPSERPIFEYKTKGASAIMRVDGNGWVILKGSTACVAEVGSCPNGIKNERKQLIDDRVLIEGPGSGLYQFACDFEFKSLASAGGVVRGGGVSGKKVWKVQGSGKSYSEWVKET